MNLHFNTTAVSSIDELLQSYPAWAFASPYRSTVPLVSLVKHRADILSALIQKVFPCIREFSGHFEFHVAPRSRGNSSQTDLMIRASDYALAIEAKWTEPRYENVGKRIASRIRAVIGEDDSRAAEARADQISNVEGWLEHLQPFCKVPLKAGDVEDIVYQLMHRAASACASAKHPALVYLHFSDNQRSGADAEAYKQDLGTPYDRMGSPSSCPFYFVELPISPTAAFERIATLKKGKRDTDVAVRNALKTEPLFAFAAPQITQIASKPLSAALT